MTTDVIKLDPFDDRFRDLEIQHRAEEQRINAETDWLEFFPEAKDYIVERAIEIGKQISETKRSLKTCTEKLVLEEDYSEKQTALIIAQVFLETEINQLARQLHLLTQEVNKHLSKKYRSSSQKPDGHFTISEVEGARAFPLVDLFERDGRMLKRSGMNFVTLCPFHDERTPSCQIYVSENQYHCFSCGAHGNPIDYMMDLHKMSFREVLGYLLGRSE